MDETYWQKLQAIFDEALGIPPAQRAAFVAHACAGEPRLSDEVMSLLDAHLAATKKWNQQSPVVPPFGGISSPYKTGDDIGHHRIIDQIGVGGMGVVYQAFDSRLERDVALKFLPANMHSKAESRQRFMAEARAASRLDHPNICVIHDINETPEGHLYITMPYYQGETLAARLKRGCLQSHDALAVTIQVADGLAAAHANDIVHRDIKPANIMLTQDRGVKILDFGIAKVANIHLTSTGMGIGTLAYMAPEQMRGQEVDARADIWALGVTLYEMLTGKTAFDGDGASQVVEAVLTDDRAASISDCIPPALHSILSKAMQRNRNARYADIKSMLEDCLQIQASQGTNLQVTRRANHLTKNDNIAFEWEPAFLDIIIALLTPTLGPISTKLVQRQARHASNIDQLCSALCDLLPDDITKRSFAEKMKLKAAMNTTPPAVNPVNVSNPSNHLELTPVQLAKLESCLLPYVGPIAGSLIRRAIATSGDRDVVCQILAESLTNPAEQLTARQKMKSIMTE